MAGVSRDARHVYDGLTVRADDEGRGTANAALLKANVLPFDEDATPERIGGWLHELETAGLVALYEADGRAHFAIVSWTEDQRVDKPTPSKLPAPPADILRESSRGIVEEPGTARLDGPEPRAEAKPDVPRDSSRTIANVPASRASKTGPGPGPGPDLSSSPDGAETETSDAIPERPEVAHLCHLLSDLILSNDPKAKTTPDGKRWRDDMRLLLDADGRDASEIETVIRYVQADRFERCNVLSPGKLRSRFTALKLKADTPNGNGHRPAVTADFAKYDAAARRAAA